MTYTVVKLVHIILKKNIPQLCFLTKVTPLLHWSLLWVFVDIFVYFDSVYLFGKVWRFWKYIKTFHFPVTSIIVNLDLASAKLRSEVISSVFRRYKRIKKSRNINDKNPTQDTNATDLKKNSVQKRLNGHNTSPTSSPPQSDAGVIKAFFFHFNVQQYPVSHFSILIRHWKIKFPSPPSCLLTKLRTHFNFSRYFLLYYLWWQEELNTPLFERCSLHNPSFRTAE